MNCDKYFLRWKSSELYFSASLSSNRGETALECIQILWYQDLRMQLFNQFNFFLLHNVRFDLFTTIFFLCLSSYSFFFFKFCHNLNLLLVLSWFDCFVQIFFRILSLLFFCCCCKYLSSIVFSSSQNKSSVVCHNLIIVFSSQFEFLRLSKKDF